MMYYLAATLSTHYSPPRTTLPRLRSNGYAFRFALDLATADF